MKAAQIPIAELHRALLREALASAQALLDPAHAGVLRQLAQTYPVLRNWGLIFL